MGLPFAILPNLACASLGDQLHLVALTASTPRTVMHVALNADARPAGEPSVLPLGEVDGLAACAGALVATGKTNGAPSAIGLDPDGTTRWQCAIPVVPGPQIMAPRPLCLDDKIGLVWASAGDGPTNQSSVWLAMVSDGRADRPQRIAGAGPSGEMSITAAEDAIVVVQKWHDPPRLELVGQNGATTRTRPKQTRHQVLEVGDNPGAPALIFLEDHFVLSWIAASAGEIRMQAFNRGLNPLAPSSVIQRVERPARPRSVRLVLGGAEHERQAAIVTSIAKPTVGPAISHGPDLPTSRPPGLEIEAFVAAYDRAGGTPGPWQPLTDLPLSYDAAGWAADRLIVIGGGADAQLAVFR
jgi:hypothetical protein